MPGIKEEPEGNDELDTARTRAHDAPRRGEQVGVRPFRCGTHNYTECASQGADPMACAALFAWQGLLGLRLFGEEKNDERETEFRA